RPAGESIYEYPDRQGNPLVRVKRIDDGQGRKRFIQEQWDGHQWRKGLSGVDRSQIPIYRYADVRRAIERGTGPKLDGKPLVVWVEGEATADALWGLGIPATTSIGGSGGFTSYGSYYADLAGASLVIAPDRDQKGLEYARQVAAAFNGNVVGWIYAGDKAYWQDPSDGYDLGDLISDLRAEGLDDAAIRSRILAAIEPCREAVMSSPPDVPGILTGKDEKAHFLETALRDLYSEVPYICLNQTHLYRWAGTHYELVPDDAELSRIAAYCRERGKPSPSTIKSVLELQKLTVGVTADKVNPPGYFNCTNGVLHWWWEGSTLRWELLPHSPDLLFIDSPTVTYDPSADDSQLNRLLECLEPPHREILVRTLACALDLPNIRRFRSREPKALLLYGQGANGKDAIRTAIFRLFGGRGCTAVSLSDFQAYDSGRKFPLADLEFSRVNWPSETVPVGKLDRVESLKLVVTGDPISIERKGIQERRMTPQTVLLFNCNQPPNLMAATDAIKTRYAIVPFNRVYKQNPDASRGELQADPRFKDDPQFIDKEILPALLNLLLVKLQAVATEGIDYTPVDDQIQELRRRSSHLVRFCEDVGLIEDPDGMVSVNELWQRLEAWYQQENYLTVETGARGGQKRQWEHPHNDRCITASHQVLARFTELFPKIKRVSIRYTDPATGKDVKQTGLKGINFVETSEIAFQGFQSTAKQEQNPHPDGDTATEPYPSNRVPEGFQEGSVGFQNPDGWKAMEGYRNPNGTLLNGEPSKPETPMNTEQNDQNAVQRKAWNPISEVSALRFDFRLSC
ncbi:MAG: DUF5906 domain-containing protein, partial [Oscillatoriaceae bacterium SKYG93]|nr:DUF5906 domain-containing protein [Oscillatoriaceae bacterium SKYG93]MDW8451994.1 DUF5906 domain-containing protein [Oscillatoriaceae cyanobacterium SKYGB_i_bin93]